MTDVEALKEILWQKAEPLYFAGREKFLSDLEGWEVKPVEIGGELAFITVRNGPHFHFQSLDTGRRITLPMIREFLTPIIKEHGYAATKTPIDDTRQQRFNRRFGFEQVGRDDFDIHFRIERLPHV